MAEKSEKDLLLYHLDRKIKKAIESYRLIENGDRILIGLSGGKDSLALVELLGKRMKIFSPRFTAIAVHIRMKNISYKSDTSYLKEHCEHSSNTRRSSIPKTTNENLPVSSVRGIGAKRCSP